MSKLARQQWFSSMIQAGLEHEIFEPEQVLNHVTPEVMAHNLPPEIMSQVLQISLAAGEMTPEKIMEALNPEVLAEHIPHEVLWECIAAAADREALRNKRRSKKWTNLVCS
ncbi:MAG: hypothetical protein JKY56_13210 [Kofleriaceae bacterium]|nr:hypothetical protein [Kofleriaceae bacterium]